MGVASLTSPGQEMNPDTARTHARVLRGPYQMTLDITNKCNLRCLHCFNRSGENPIVEDELSDDEVVAFLRDVAGIKPFNLCFCGGEPLLRRELLLQGIKILADGGVKASTVTNGQLMTAEIARRMADAGIYQVQVSVDGATPESHDRLRNRRGCFAKALKAIEHLAAAKIKVGVAFTPTRWSIGEVEPLARRLRDLGVSAMRVQALMVMGRGQVYSEDINPTAGQYRRLVADLRRLRNTDARGDSFHLEWGDPVDHLIRFSDMLDRCCPFIAVRANGAIIPSIYLPLTVGSVRRHAFSEYWDAGLARLWRLPLLKSMAARVRSVPEMGGGDDGTPRPYWERDLEVDFIDDLLFQEVAV